MLGGAVGAAVLVVVGGSVRGTAARVGVDGDVAVVLGTGRDGVVTGAFAGATGVVGVGAALRGDREVLSAEATVYPRAEATTTLATAKLARRRRRAWGRYILTFLDGGLL